MWLRGFTITVFIVFCFSLSRGAHAQATGVTPICANGAVKFYTAQSSTSSGAIPLDNGVLSVSAPGASSWVSHYTVNQGQHGPADIDRVVTNGNAMQDLGFTVTTHDKQTNKDSTCTITDQIVIFKAVSAQIALIIPLTNTDSSDWQASIDKLTIGTSLVLNRVLFTLHANTLSLNGYLSGPLASQLGSPINLVANYDSKTNRLTLNASESQPITLTLGPVVLTFVNFSVVLGNASTTFMATLSLPFASTAQKVPSKFTVTLNQAGGFSGTADVPTQFMWDGTTIALTDFKVDTKGQLQANGTVTVKIPGVCANACTFTLTGFGLNTNSTGDFVPSGTLTFSDNGTTLPNAVIQLINGTGTFQPGTGDNVASLTIGATVAISVGTNYAVTLQADNLVLNLDAHGNPTFDFRKARIGPAAGTTVTLFDHDVAACTADQQKQIASIDTLAIGIQPIDICLGLHIMPGHQMNNDDLALLDVALDPTAMKATPMRLKVLRLHAVAPVGADSTKPTGIKLTLGATRLNVSAMDLVFANDLGQPIAGFPAFETDEIPEAAYCEPFVAGSLTVDSFTLGGDPIKATSQPYFAFGSNCFALSISGLLSISPTSGSNVTLNSLVISYASKADFAVARHVVATSTPVPPPVPTATPTPRPLSAAFADFQAHNSTAVALGHVAATPAPVAVVAVANAPSRTQHYFVAASGSITSGNITIVFDKVGFRTKDGVKCEKRQDEYGVAFAGEFCIMQHIDPWATAGVNIAKNPNVINQFVSNVGTFLAGLIIK